MTPQQAQQVWKKDLPLTNIHRSWRKVSPSHGAGTWANLEALRDSLGEEESGFINKPAWARRCSEGNGVEFVGLLDPARSGKLLWAGLGLLFPGLGWTIWLSSTTNPSFLLCPALRSQLRFVEA